MIDHIVRRYDDELKHLGETIAEMGGMAERQVSEAVNTLLSRDSDRAEHIIKADRAIDQMQHDVEERAILIIAKRQPMAIDLREIVAAMRISGDIERIGDLAKNIAKRALALEGPFQSAKLAKGLDHLGQLVLRQLKAVLDAYACRDAHAALEVWKSDGEIDALHTSLFRELLTYMMEDPRNIGFCTHLLFCAKNIERIGDHATNIAETIHYVVTGHQIADERPKEDMASTLSV
jgi:phosphate transport system protein